MQDPSERAQIEPEKSPPFIPFQSGACTKCILVWGGAVPMPCLQTPAARPSQMLIPICVVTEKKRGVNHRARGYSGSDLD